MRYFNKFMLILLAACFIGCNDDMADIAEEISKKDQVEIHISGDNFGMSVNDTESFPVSGTDDQPLFVVDGVITSQKALKEIKPSKIDAISIYKGEKAIALYGPENAKNGVVVIKLK